MKFLIICTFAVFLISCSSDTKLSILNTNSITGFAQTFNSSSSLDTITMSCSDIKINLHALDSSGNKIEPELATTSVDSSGRYEFKNANNYIQFSNNLPTQPYMIESIGCSKKYSRILTGNKNQDITYGTSLVSFTLETELKDELANTHTKLNLLNELYNAVKNSASYSDAYTAINSDADNKSKFEDLFDNGQPLVLQNAPPIIQEINLPKEVNENENKTISVNSFHWSPSYSQAFIWKLGNEVISNSPTFNFTFNKNIQGNRTISLYIGQDDGAGNLDLTKPYLTKAYSVLVHNTYPATTLSLSSPTTITTDRNIILNIDTGAGLDHCNTFSKFAISENTSSIPSFSDFVHTCTTSNNQVLSYNLKTPGSGNKTLRLWTIDSSGNVSSSPSVINNITLDEDAPSINQIVINSGSQYTGTPFVNINVDITDLTPPIEVKFAEAHFVTGDCQSEYTNSDWLSYSSNLTPHTFLVSNSDSLKKICAWAKDSLGNISVFNPTSGVAGVNFDEITYEVGNVPDITLFKITNNSSGVNFGTETYSMGDEVKIEWEANDIEGFDNNPASIYYTTDDQNWLPVVIDYGNLINQPTVYNSTYTQFTAPTSNFFKLKIVMKDKSGNFSFPIISNPQNTGNWSVYAGTSDRGAGSSAASVSLKQSRNGNLFAINKLNNDFYFIDRGHNLVKMDSTTGLTEVFIQYGTTNLSASGTINSNSKIRTDLLRISISDDGYLYLLDSTSRNVTADIFKVNLADKTYIKYMQGGNNVDLTTATPNDVYILDGPMAIDESNSLYLLSKCENTNWDRNNDAFQIMKITQKSDGTADQVQHFAGNCVRGSLPGDGPFTAVNSEIGEYLYPGLGNFAVWDNGSKFYFYFHSKAPLKIINGNIYKTSLPSGSGISLHYIKSKNLLYVGRGFIRAYTPNLNGANGETYTTFVNNSGSSDTCLNDGTLANQACVNSYFTMQSNANGNLFFTDGPAVNAGRDYRVRYVDSENKIRTIAGNLPFYGDGKDKSIMRGEISGIYYKKTSEPNQTSFPSGLYFMENKGVLMGYIDPTTQVVETLFGSQKGTPASYNTGDQLLKTSNLGRSYSGGNGYPLSFVNGLPYIKYEYRVMGIDSDKKVIAVQNNGSVFHNANDGSTASNYGAHVYGGMQNFTFKDNGLFLIGRYHNNSSASYANREPGIKYLDFTSDLVTKVMGDTGEASTPDTAVPGQVKDASLSSACLNNSKCYVQYINSQDRLYFVEKNKFRYIQNPTDNSSSTLGTLFTSSSDIYNFIFKEDLSMIFYSKSDGHLYCHDISSGKAWCDDTSLGPPSGFESIGRGPNQFTWADSTTLLISNYKGLIYKYKLQD